MPLVWLIGLVLIYVGVQAFGTRKLFPSVDGVMIFITFLVSGVLAFLGLLSSGLVSVPLAPEEMWRFIPLLFLFFTVFNSFALKMAMEKPRLGFIGSIPVAIALNLVLTLLLGAPLFYATLVTSDMLFK